MSGRIVVHFGTPKTGSTSIQLTLSRRSADAGFHYVDLGRAGPNDAIIIAFADDPNRYQFIRRQQFQAAEMAAIRDRVLHRLQSELLQSKGCEVTLLSCEAIYGLRQNEVATLHGALRRDRRRLEAVGYLRSPKEFVASSFQQNLKGHDIRDLDLQRFFPNYHQQIATLDAVFGRDNVHCWLFDPASFPAGCVVQDFCGRLGIGIPSGRVVRSNDGLSLPATGLLFTYRKFGPGYGTGHPAIAENRSLIRALARLSGPKLCFHAELMRPLFARRKAALAWLEERLGVRVADTWDERHPAGVRSERDLLTVSPDTWDWLRRQLPHLATPSAAPSDPREVAGWVHALRLKEAAGHSAPKGGGS
jgi:hypothetical protein